MTALGTVRSVFSVIGACWFGACSFPDYRVDESKVDSSPSRICSDGLPSEAETGIDCGGGCPPCAMGEACRVSADCVSGSCVNKVCQAPTCDDRVKNATEADIDCGGNCAPCPPGRDCQAAIDCEQHVCASASSDCNEGDCGPVFCQVPTCTDLVQNGTETGTDCGSKCDPCANGMGCLVDADCASGYCTDGVCVALRCTNGMQNGLETDKDCGGTECARCGPGKTCKEGSDCASRVCETGACAKDGCDDTVKNRDESDVDCGGTTCDGCGELLQCVGGTDCASGMCLMGLCVPAIKTGETLSRDGWHAAASNSYPDHKPDQVLDSVGGRFTTNANQYDGMWFEVDMGKPQAFFEIELTCTEQVSDVPVEYQLFLAMEKGKYGSPAGPSKFGGTVSTYSFDTARVARYFKVVLRQAKDKWWSINEINVRK